MSLNLDEISRECGLLEASRKGETLTVKRLLEGGASPNTSSIVSGYSALHYAATKGHLETVMALVAAGAEIHYRDGTVHGTALSSAVIAGRTVVVRYLLSIGADPTERLFPDGKTLVDEAQDHGDVEIAALLRQYL